MSDVAEVKEAIDYLDGGEYLVPHDLEWDDETERGYHSWLAVVDAARRWVRVVSGQNCEECDGTGIVNGPEGVHLPCRTCGGSGDSTDRFEAARMAARESFAASDGDESDALESALAVFENHLVAAVGVEKED